MIAYHGQQAIKNEYLARVRAHREADQLVQHYGYWKDGKGCAVGCTLHSAYHAAYETELGIPRILARLEDSIFEGLSVEKAREWPERFLSAIAPGADLSVVSSHFFVWMLGDPVDGAIRHAKTDRKRAVIQRVVSLYQRTANGEIVEENEWRYAADAAAYYADAAAEAAAAYAADADAEAADYAAYYSAAHAAFFAAAAAAADADDYADAAAEAAADADAEADYTAAEVAAYYADADADAYIAAADAFAAAALIRQEKRSKQADKLIELMSAQVAV